MNCQLLTESKFHSLSECNCLFLQNFPLCRPDAQPFCWDGPLAPPSCKSQTDLTVSQMPARDCMHSLQLTSVYTNTNYCPCTAGPLLPRGVTLRIHCVCPGKSLEVYKLPKGKQNCWQKTVPISHMCARETPVLLGENYQMAAPTTRFDQNNVFQVFQVQEIIRVCLAIKQINIKISCMFSNCTVLWLSWNDWICPLFKKFTSHLPSSSGC